MIEKNWPSLIHIRKVGNIDGVRGWMNELYIDGKQISLKDSESSVRKIYVLIIKAT